MNTVRQGKDSDFPSFDNTLQEISGVEAVEVGGSCRRLAAVGPGGSCRRRGARRLDGPGSRRRWLRFPSLAVFVRPSSWLRPPTLSRALRRWRSADPVGGWLVSAPADPAARGVGWLAPGSHPSSWLRRGPTRTRAYTGVRILTARPFFGGCGLAGPASDTLAAFLSFPG